MWNRGYKVKVKGQILNFLVNASPPNPSDIVTSNSSCIGKMMLKALGNILYGLDLMVKVK